MATVYIVGTPIGNLEDITLRGIETLKNVSLILAEDTRVTKKLLDRYDISTPLFPCHQHSTEKTYARAKDELDIGNDVALVTDAGTPGISDPGGKLIEYIVENSDHTISPIPGVSALTTALSISGMPTDRFTFYGFLPHKKGRQTMIKQIMESDMTSGFFESPHRIMKLLDQIEEYAKKEKKILIMREGTKKFETLYRGTTEDIEILKNTIKEKGEFTVIISA
jgi:16S rRNA (cytidine1402-2'-O)-methyltransferase